MFQGVRSVSWLSIVRITIVLALLSVCNEKVNSSPTTTEKPSVVPPSVPKISGLKSEKSNIKNLNKTIRHVQNDEANEDLHSELNVLLTELRQISDKIETIRKEHNQLADGVNEISIAVKSMNERSEHIKKKVRKMSKAINKTTHHHKLKNSLKSLQKDHKRILEVMLNSTFLLHSHRSNHSASSHRNKNGSKHSNKHSKICHDNESPHCNTIYNTTNNKDEDKTSDENKTSNIIPTVTSSSTRTLQTVSPAPFVSKKEEDTLVSPEEKDNIIPEPVIEPQGKSESPKKSPPLPIDCTEVIQMGNMTSGIYRIKPKGLNEPIKVTPI